ncbi:MAG TPA: PAS domain-containing protein [Candidatus Angelobacter sp.]|nr:PAS domain-containing protein [Candidatus Angelobacter sp.]
MTPVVFPLRPAELTGPKAYGVALAAVAVAFFFSWIFTPGIYAIPFMFFFGAVMVSAWFGQFQHGLFAALLSVVIADYFFAQPIYQFLKGPEEIVRDILFLVISATLAYLTSNVQKSEGRMRRVLSSITDGFLAVNRDWVCVFINEPGALFLHKVPHQLLRRNVWEVFPEAVGGKFYDECQRAMREQRSLHFEEYFGPADAWYEAAAYPSKDGMAIVYRDITERKRAEKEQERLLYAEKIARHQSEAEREKTEQLLASITEGFCVLDHNWNITYINDVAVQIVGRRHEEIIGKNHWEVVPESVGTVVEREYRRCVREGVPVQFDVSWKRLGIWLQVRAYPSPEGISILFNDVTEAKRREGDLRSALDRLAMAHKAAGMGTWDWNIRTNELIWSEEISRIHCMPEGKFDATLQGWLRTIHPDDLARVQAQIQKALTEKGEYYAEFRVLCPGSEVRWVSGQGRVITDSAGSPVRMVGIGMDITRRRAEEEALRRTEKLAATGRLAATIAHEINNPLEAVTNLMYLINRDDSIRGDSRHMLSQAEEQLSRINHIAKQTLGFYRERSTAESVDLVQIVEDLVSIFKPRLGGKHLQLLKEYDKVRPVQVFTGELRQVISNLITNAIEASSQHGKIIIRVREATGDAPGVQIEVEDFGSGIKTNDQERIFEPFFTTKADIGTGLGLWVTRQIIEKHGGKLDFRTSTEEGRSGTCFSVFLPRIARSAAQSTAKIA